MSRKLSIGFLSPHNPFDRSAFSGTAFHMHRALAHHGGIELRLLGGHRPVGRLARLLRRLKSPKEILADTLDVAGLDWIVALTATGLADSLVARSSVRVAHVTDATPSFLREYYGMEISPEAEAVEARLVRAGDLTIYSSHYMARRAEVDFGPDVAGKVATVPFGANFDTVPSELPEKPPLSPLKLLWVGSQWARKGGQLALATHEALRSKGVAAELSLIGNVPKEVEGLAGVIPIGYLDKSKPDAAGRLRQEFSDAHVFILPTRADCTPMVVAEANAHGTPVLITDTGGIPSLMAEGGNGRMLPMEAGPADWAAAICDITADPEAYAELCRTSFEHARTRLTWDAWANDVVELLRERCDTGAYPVR